MRLGSAVMAVLPCGLLLEAGQDAFFPPPRLPACVRSTGAENAAAALSGDRLKDALFWTGLRARAAREPTTTAGGDADDDDEEEEEEEELGTVRR